MRHLAHLMTGLSKMTCCLYGHFSTEKILKLHMVSTGESALCLRHTSYSLTGWYPNAPRKRFFLPSFSSMNSFFSDSYCNIFHQYAFEVVFFFFFSSLFKLKTNLFDLEFQNQSFMVLIHGIWHFTVNSSC